MDKTLQSLATTRIKLGRLDLRQVVTRLRLSDVLDACAVPPKIDAALLKKHDAPLPDREKGDYRPPRNATACRILEAMLSPRGLALSVEDAGVFIRPESDVKALLNLRPVTYRDLLNE